MPEDAVRKIDRAAVTTERSCDPLLSGWLGPVGSAGNQPLDTKTYKCPSPLSGLQIPVRNPQRYKSQETQGPSRNTPRRSWLPAGCPCTWPWVTIGGRRHRQSKTNRRPWLKSFKVHKFNFVLILLKAEGGQDISYFIQISSAISRERTRVLL